VTRILASQSDDARAKGEALIRQAGELLCNSWNEEMWAAMSECEEHGWTRGRPIPTRDRAYDIARRYPPAGVSPDEATTSAMDPSGLRPNLSSWILKTQAPYFTTSSQMQARDPNLASSGLANAYVITAACRRAGQAKIKLKSQGLPNRVRLMRYRSVVPVDTKGDEMDD